MPPFFRCFLKGRAYHLYPKQLCKEGLLPLDCICITRLGGGQASAARGCAGDSRGISHPAPHRVLWILL